MGEYEFRPPKSFRVPPWGFFAGLLNTLFGRRMLNRTPPLFPMTGAALLTWIGSAPNQQIVQALLQEPDPPAHRFRLQVSNGLLVPSAEPYTAYVAVNGVEHQMTRLNLVDPKHAVFIWDDLNLCVDAYAYTYRLAPDRNTFPDVRLYGSFVGRTGWYVPQQGQFHSGGANQVPISLAGTPTVQFRIVNRGSRVAVTTLRIQPVQPGFQIEGLPPDFPATKIFLNCGSDFEFAVRYTGNVAGAQAQLEMRAQTSPAAGPSESVMNAFADLLVVSAPG